MNVDFTFVFSKMINMKWARSLKFFTNGILLINSLNDDDILLVLAVSLSLLYTFRIFETEIIKYDIINRIRI